MSVLFGVLVLITSPLRGQGDEPAEVRPSSAHGTGLSPTDPSVRPDVDLKVIEGGFDYDPPPIDVMDRIEEIKVREMDGELVLRYSDGDRYYSVTPEGFALALQRGKARRDAGAWVFRILNISSWGGVAWVVLGIGGQLAFTARMLIQWIRSEREKKSVIPVTFWWLSLVGATLMIVYFIWRKDVVGVAGQTTGFYVYLRNLVLIYRPNKPDSLESSRSEDDAQDESASKPNSAEPSNQDAVN